MVGIRREVEVSPVVALELGISHFLPSLFLFFSLFFRLDYNLHGFDFYHSCFLLGGRIFNLTHLGSGLVILGQTTPPLWECLLCTTAYLLFYGICTLISHQHDYDRSWTSHHPFQDRLTGQAWRALVWRVCPRIPPRKSDLGMPWSNFSLF